MFLCSECHEKGGCKRAQFLEEASRGRCENCGEVRSCTDCQGYDFSKKVASPLRNETPPMLVVETPDLRVERLVSERLHQHRENLALWESGYLDPTEPYEEERHAIKRELKAAIKALEEIEKLFQI